MTALSFENLGKAYNGRVGCMCGCNGDYAYTDDTEESARVAKRRYNSVMKSKDRVIEFGMKDEVIVYTETDTRTTVLYFR